MPQPLIQLNAETLEQANGVRARLQASSSLRLYLDDELPTPDTSPNLLTQAGYTGYQPVDLAGRWGPVEQDGTGVYAVASEVVSFPAPPSGDPQTVHLVGLVVGGQVRWLVRLGSPWVAQAGGAPLPLQVRYQHFSASLLTAPLA